MNEETKTHLKAKLLKAQIILAELFKTFDSDGGSKKNDLDPSFLYGANHTHTGNGFEITTLIDSSLLVIHREDGNTDLKVNFQDSGISIILNDANRKHFINLLNRS